MQLIQYKIIYSRLCSGERADEPKRYWLWPVHYRTSLAVSEPNGSGRSEIEQSALWPEVCEV